MALRTERRPGDGPGNDEVLLEFHRIGNAVRVTAMDPVTATEVTIVGAPSAGREMLIRNAVRKLDYVLAKRADEVRGGRRRA
jgi:hypothetical protein